MKTLFRLLVFVNNIAFIAFYPEKNFVWWFVLVLTFVWGLVSIALVSLYIEEGR